MWCELGAELALPDLVAVGDFLVHWRLPHTSIAALTSAVMRFPGRRGRAALATAITLLNDRAESPQESRLRVILVQGGLREVVVNLRIATVEGFEYRADLAFPEAQVLLEYQGDHHRAREQFRADMTRVSRLQAEGWQVIFINADDLRDPKELLRRVRRLLAPARTARLPNGH